MPTPTASGLATLGTLAAPNTAAAPAAWTSAPTAAPTAPDTASLVVLHHVRDLAAALHREADALRAAVVRLNGHALTVRWQSSSARACLDELAELSSRMTRFAGGYDEASRAVLAHADQAEANVATAIRTVTAPASFLT